MTPGRKFYEQQIACLESADLDGLMAQYHDDATLVRFDCTVHGKEALRDFMAGYLAHLGSFELVSTDQFTETEDSIFFEATVKSSLGTVRVYDVFMLRDGKITHQFAGLLS